MKETMLRIGRLLLAVASVTAILTSCGAHRWDDKATADERAASAAVGGFSDIDHRLYHNGLQHLRNAHQRVGSLTIGQVVDQERQREEKRASARQAEADRLVAQWDHQRDTAATANLVSSLKLANSVGLPIYRGGAIVGDDCGVKIDADYFDAANDQNRSLVKQTVVQICAASYTQLGGKDTRRIPDGGVTVHLYDLAGTVVYSDIIEASAPPPPAHLNPIGVAHADPRGAYIVVDHWDIPCSGHGGFGEYVIAKSHRQVDLQAVYHRWMAEHNPDRDQCVTFGAFASNESYDATKDPTKYTDAQLEAIPDGLQYLNNPNSGYESWTTPDGKSHHGR